MDPILLHGPAYDEAANDEQARVAEVVSDPEPHRLAMALYLAAIIVALSPVIVSLVRGWL